MILAGDGVIEQHLAQDYGIPQITLVEPDKQMVGILKDRFAANKNVNRFSKWQMLHLLFQLY